MVSKPKFAEKHASPPLSNDDDCVRTLALILNHTFVFVLLIGALGSARLPLHRVVPSDAMRVVMTFVNESINFPGADGTKMVLGSSNSIPTLTNWIGLSAQGRQIPGWLLSASAKREREEDPPRSFLLV